MVNKLSKTGPDYPSCRWTRFGANKKMQKNKYDKAEGPAVISDMVHFLFSSAKTQLDQSEEDFVSGGYSRAGEITTGNRTFNSAGMFS